MSVFAPWALAHHRAELAVRVIRGDSLARLVMTYLRKDQDPADSFCLDEHPGPRLLFVAATTPAYVARHWNGTAPAVDAAPLTIYTPRHRKDDAS